VGPGNHVLDEGPDPHGKGQFFFGGGENGRPIVKYRDSPYSTVVCAKTAEPIGMPFELWVRMVPRNHKLDGGSDPPMGRGNFGGKRRPL